MIPAVEPAQAIFPTTGLTPPPGPLAARVASGALWLDELRKFAGRLLHPGSQ